MLFVHTSAQTEMSWRSALPLLPVICHLATSPISDLPHVMLFGRGDIAAELPEQVQELFPLAPGHHSSSAGPHHYKWKGVTEVRQACIEWAV